MKIIYLGTPDFAVKPLEKILSSKHNVVACVTQPDRVGSRGKKIITSPVKLLAQERGIEVLQFEKISSMTAVEQLKDLNADIMVTCAYGQILSDSVLTLTKNGVINIHASLLPKYRGSSPVQWALICGETQVGNTIMQTAKEVDSGDIILQRKINLKGEENTAEVLELLSKLGADMIVEALDLIEQGKAEFIKQDHSQASYFPMLKKEDGRMNFNKTALELANFVRGMNPWPSAFMSTKYGILKVKKAKAIYDEKYDNAQIGQVVESHPKVGLIIKCVDGCLSLIRVQGENAKEMDIGNFLLGKPIIQGSFI